MTDHKGCAPGGKLREPPWPQITHLGCTPVLDAPIPAGVRRAVRIGLHGQTTGPRALGRPVWRVPSFLGERLPCGNAAAEETRHPGF